MTLFGFSRPIRVLVMGATRGLGSAFVQRLLATPNVAQVWALGRAISARDDLPFGDADGANLRRIDADLTDERSLARVAALVQAEGSPLDVVVHFAGVLHGEAGMAPERKLAEIQAEQVLLGFQINALGPLLLAKHLQPCLPKRGRCLWVNLSARVGSIADNRLGGWYTYRASKAAQNMFTKNIAIELGRRHRDLICIAYHPGTCATDLSAPFRGNVPAGKLFDTAQGVTYLWQLMDDLQAEHHGGFYAWDGAEIPW